jgi:filamentous hemagglutinin
MLTKAGRALQKHSGRSGSAFNTSATKAADLNKAGQNIVDQIVNNPRSVEKGNRLGGIDIFATDGRGLRFNADGTFRGFLEP